MNDKFDAQNYTGIVQYSGGQVFLKKNIWSQHVQDRFQSLKGVHSWWVPSGGASWGPHIFQLPVSPFLNYVSSETEKELPKFRCKQSSKHS